MKDKNRHSLKRNVQSKYEICLKLLIIRKLKINPQGDTIINPADR